MSSRTDAVFGGILAVLAGAIILFISSCWNDPGMSAVDRDNIVEQAGDRDDL